MYKDSAGQASFFVDFTYPMVIDFFCLDLCWIAPGGNADLSINNEGLKKAFNEAPTIKAQCNRLHKMIDEIERKEHGEGMAEFKGITRIAKFSRVHALLVVNEYTRKLSLLPEEVDFV